MKLLTLACAFGSAAAFIAPAFKAPAARSVQARTSMMAEKSKSIPFLPRPEKLDGSIAGDVGASVCLPACLVCLACLAYLPACLLGWA